MKHALIKILLVTSFIAFAGLLVQREFSVIFSRGAIPRRHDSSFETRPVTKPVVSATNDHRPTLTSGTVTPSTGNTNSTMFMFSVVYTDRDNNPATFVNVTLNWWVWAMHKVDTSDSNYVDGCTYMYSTMLNAAWNYSFSFSCSDGTFTDSASATSGPSVRMPIIPWNMTWNDGRNNYGRGVFSSDGFVYTCGYVSSWNGYYDIMVIKWDTNGNVMWNQTWGGNQGDTGMDIWCDGSKVYITGYTSSYGAGQDDVVLIIYNVDGTFVSYNTFGGPDDDYGNCIWGDPQAIYIGGRTDVNSTQGDDILLLKLSKTGTLVFNRTWGGTGTDAAYGIWGDGSAIYVCGYTNSFGEGSCDAVITKWTGTGDFQWFKTWGGRSYEYGLGIWGDGANIYITGYTGSFGIGSSDAFIVTWTAGGTFVFYRTWGGLFYDEGNCIWGIGANIYISGYTNSFGTGRYALFLLKLGPDGILQLVKTCDGILNLWVYGIHGNQDSMYLCGSEYDGIRYNLFITRISLAGEFGIISPCYGEKTRQYQRITFQWSEANFTGDTITYTWQLSSSTLFTTAVYDIDTMTSIPTCTIRLNCSAGRYYWRVRAMYGVIAGNWYSYAALDIDNPNMVPVLRAASVSPSNGTQRTSFSFSIIYSDANNDTPSLVRLHVGNQSYAMCKQLNDDDNFVAGILYITSIILLPGTYNPWFEASDGFDTIISTSLFGPVVTLSTARPVLSNPSVSPNTGSDGTDFTFRVTYSHSEGIAPSYVHVHLNYDVITLYKDDANDKTYNDGCDYVYRTRLVAGCNYSFYFVASDGYDIVETASFTGPTVTNGDPALSGLTISPRSGDNSTVFRFTILYTHPDNLPPHSVYIIIGSSQYTMIKEDPADNDFTNGCNYTYSTRLQASTYDVYAYCRVNNSYAISSETERFTVQVATIATWNAAQCSAFLVILAVGVSALIGTCANIHKKHSTSSQQHPVTVNQPIPQPATTHPSPSWSVPVISTATVNSANRCNEPIQVASVVVQRTGSLPASAFVPTLNEPPQSPADSGQPVPSLPANQQRELTPVQVPLLLGTPKWKRLMRFDISQYSDPDAPDHLEIAVQSDPVPTGEPITRENVKDELATPVSCIAPASVPEPARGRRLKSWNDDFDEPALGLAKRRRFKSWDDAINELAPGTSSAKLWVMQDDTTRTKSWDGGTDRLAPGVPSAKSWVVQEDTAQAKFDDDSTGGLAPDVPSTKPLMAILHCKPCLPDSVQDKEIVRHTERILSCPICGARINVHDVADGLLYSCKKCKKEMEIEIECPKCFGKIMHNQISFASPGSHGIKCPTCWEAVQM